MNTRIIFTFSLSILLSFLLYAEASPHKRHRKRKTPKSSLEVPPPNICGPDEQYYDCVPNCRNTCATYNRKDIGCPASCAPGCFCKEGTVKNDDGSCVPISECSSSGGSRECDYGEVYYDKCAPSCGGTCQAYYNPGIFHCPRCRPGCWCDEGYYKNDDGECVLPEQCDGPDPTACSGINEEIVPCAKPCTTCLIRGNCKLKRCVEGCDCKSGYYRDESGTCIPEDQCPGATPIPPGCPVPICQDGCFIDNSIITCPQCKCPFSDPIIPIEPCRKGEEFLECGSACPPTCANLGQNRPCSLQCVRGCFCEKGKVRNDDGTCVKPEECPRTCPLNQQFYDCTPDCENRCNPPDVCSAICKIGCFCEKGLVLREDGECVQKEFCKDTNNEKCPKNEVHTNCVIPCNDCETKGKCNFLVCNKGCDCRKGYYRNSSGKCIPELHCPIIEPTSPPISDECSLPKKVGPCRARIPRFFYNSQTGQCEKFEYGGCRGNGNNFGTRNECEEKCVPSTCPQIRCRSECPLDETAEPCPRCMCPPPPPPPTNDICSLPKKVGPCRAIFPRFYYNSQTGQCEGFNYGGCQGNKNNFETIDECEQACGSDVSCQ